MVDYIRPANDDFPERIHCSVTREGMLVYDVGILCVVHLVHIIFVNQRVNQMSTKFVTLVY